MVCTGDAVSQLPHRMPSTPQVLPTASPARMQSASLSGCSRGLDLGVDVGRRRHGWASGTMQISAEVAVSGAMGMGILLATLEATVQYVPLSDQLLRHTALATVAYLVPGRNRGVLIS